MGNIAQFELHDIGYVEEDAYGVTPANPTWLELWHNASSLVPKRTTLQSRRKLGNRQRPLPRLGKKRVDGNIDSELAFAAFDDWLEALFGGRFPSSAFTQVAGITLAAVASSQTITDSGSGLTDVEVGDWIIVAGFAAANNNGVFHVSAAAAGAITVEYGTTLTDESAGASVTVDQQLRLEAGSDGNEGFTDISGTTIAAVAGTQTITDSGSGFGDVEVGDWVVVAGFAASNNNGIFEVTAAAAGVITVASGSTLTDESATPTITITQKLDRSFSVIGRYKDQAIYHLFKGVMTKTGTFTVVPDDISKVSLGLLGADFDKDATAPSGLTSPGVYEPFDALSGSFTEDGSAVCMTNLALTVENNNGLADKCLGTTVAGEQFRGGFDISGTIKFYFKDNTHITKFWEESAIAIVFTLSDPDGNQYTFGLPSCKLTELDLPKGESDVEAEEGYNLTAGEDPITGVTVYLIKTAA
ncbi:MAG: hypothetical protein DRJ65_00095 [Acidobacteria bacterium]|nr:MAG: hypothetical protein DRJ65_00095 [Acidobacteriota bacterium]